MSTFQLTSNNRLVNDKEFEVNPLTIESYSLLSEACVNDDPVPFMKAMVDSTNFTDQELSIGDVLQLAVYHRINEYRDAPLRLTWDCQGTLIEDSVGNFYTHEQFSENDDIAEAQVVQCETHNSVSFGMNNFPFIYLPEVELGDDLAIPTASLYPEYIELSKDPKLAKLIPALCWIKTDTNTLAAKIKRAEDEGTELLRKAMQASYKYQHGPASKLVAECTKCGLKVTKPVTVNQHSFFK